MRPREIMEAMRLHFLSGVPAFFEGSPGVGKTGMVKTVCKELGWDLIIFNPNNKNTADLSGMPVVQGNRTHWTLNDYWPAPDCGPTGLFIDEITTAPVSMQPALYTITNERRINNHQFNDNVRIICAGNKLTDKAIANKLSTALVSRLCVYTFAIDDDNRKFWVRDWAKWAYANDIHEDVISFVLFRPDCFYTFDPRVSSKVITDQAFACPRTLELLSKVHKAGPNPKIAYRSYSGLIGEAAATEFMAFLAIKHNVPDVNFIISNPDKADIPERPDILYATVSALVKTTTKVNFGPIMRWVKRIPDADRQFFYVRDVTRRDKSLVNTNEYVRWHVENEEIDD